MTAPLVADIIRECFEDAPTHTVRGVFDEIESRGYLVQFGTVKRTIGRMVQEKTLVVVGRHTSPDRRIFALGQGVVAMPDDCPVLAPVGVLPTRRLDPMAWIVFTSGAQAEAPA